MLSNITIVTVIFRRDKTSVIIIIKINNTIHLKEVISVYQYNRYSNKYQTFLKFQQS